MERREAVTAARYSAGKTSRAWCSAQAPEGEGERGPRTTSRFRTHAVGGVVDRKSCRKSSWGEERRSRVLSAVGWQFETS